MSCVTFLLVPNGHQGVQTVLQSHDLESHVEGGQDEDTDSVGTVDSQCLCLVHPMHSFYIIALNIVLLTWLNRWGEWHVAKRAVRICHRRSLLHLPWLSLEFQIEKCYILGIHKWTNKRRETCFLFNHCHIWMPRGSHSWLLPIVAKWCCMSLIQPMKKYCVAQFLINTHFNTPHLYSAPASGETQA